MSDDGKKTEDDTTGPTDEQKGFLKSILNEVLDEREAKKADADAEKKKDDDAPEAKRTTPKPTIIQTLFGG